MNIITNHAVRFFKFRDEVPARILAQDFGHLDADESCGEFIQYRRQWYHLSDFLRTSGQLADMGYQGVVADSYYSGVALRVSNDGETYKIATILT